MIYSPLTVKAMQICHAAHKDAVDKAGVPYVFHPYHLAEQMDTEDAICLALLHDVVEDTPLTLFDLKAEGFPEAVIEALGLLTHDPAVPYLDYVKVIAENPLARKVKIADLTHNSDITRIPNPTDRDRARIQKYAQALQLLNA